MKQRPSSMRASDADRDRVAEVLHRAYADGRLTVDEHEERVNRLLTARTFGELATLTSDLLEEQDQPIIVDDGPVNAFFRGTSRNGRWVVPERLTVNAVFTRVHLDLREALLNRRHVIIDATILGGTLELIVPDGVEVRMNDSGLLRAHRNRTRGRADAPVVEVTGSIIGGRVLARSPRRGRWSIFRRQ